MPYARWWKEWELWVLLALTGLIYFTRMGDSLPTGEEPHRGLVAREMMETGEWIVPTQQHLPFLSRPPLQNWAIAVVGAMRGSIDPIAIRLPSSICMLCTVLLIYGYSRIFLTRLGAFTAGAAFPTMGLVLQFGHLGETEAMYTLLVAASLLLWHAADLAGRPRTAWIVGYAFAALGMLTKGPQAPVYFAGGVAFYLLLTRRWRELFRGPHFLGVLMFFIVWGAWEVPFAMRVGAHDAWVMLVGDIAMRFKDDNQLLRFVKHFCLFPCEVFVCLLPWSVPLTAYLWRDFRRIDRRTQTHVLFLVAASAVAFLSCWLVSGAKNRYFAPLLPCIAPLVGLAVERCYSEIATRRWMSLWKWHLRGFALLMTTAALWVLTATLRGWGPELGEQPPRFAAYYFLMASGLTALIAWSAGRLTVARHAVAMIATMTLLGLTYNGVMLNTFIAKRQPYFANAAKVHQTLPSGTQLVSINLVDDLFAYYYGKPIRKLSEAELDPAAPSNWTYFCMGNGPHMPPCPFQYETVATFPCESAVTPNPHDVVIIARRLPGVARRDAAARR